MPPTTTMTTATTATKKSTKRDYEKEYDAFVKQYPQYKDTDALDRLRRHEFSRLDKANEVYVDYMGGCLWPKSLVTGHAALLKSGLFGNTHSDSPCATRSDQHIHAARSAVLKFFDAPSEEYVCIFTSNATNALKLVGESFPFTAESHLVLPADCHNSVNGLRNFAEAAGGAVHYLPTARYGGFEESQALSLFEMDRHASHAPSLFVLTGQSNITGIRPSLSILSHAKKAGYSTLVDAAALASSARISLKQLPDADAMAVSFYKMFGYPTGVGALVAKKSFLGMLERKWFSGGTVDFVQAPGNLILHAADLTARFEEGTLNYSSLSAIAPGLQLLNEYMPHMSIRLPILHQYLHNALESLVYPNTQTRLVQIHTRPRSPIASHLQSRSTHSFRHQDRPVTPDVDKHKIRLTKLSSPSFARLFGRPSFSSGIPTPFSDSEGEESSAPFNSVGELGTRKGTEQGQGYVVSCTFYKSSGEMIPLSNISKLASAAGISLRTGCVCNPGGATALRGKVIQERMDCLSSLLSPPLPSRQPTSFACSSFDTKARPVVPLERIIDAMGGLDGAGVVRLSLGMASNFEDVWRVVTWAKGLLDESRRDKDLEALLH